MAQQNSDSLKTQPSLKQDSIQLKEQVGSKADSIDMVVDSTNQTAVPSIAKKDSVKETLPQPIPAKTATSNTSLQQQKVRQELKAEKPKDASIHPFGTITDTMHATPSVAVSKDVLPAPALRPQNSSIWEIMILIMCILMVAFVKGFNKRRFTVLINSFFNSRVIPSHLREENAFSNQVIVVLTIVFVLVIATAVHQVANFWIPDDSEYTFRLYAQICLFIVLIYIVKFSLLELLAEVFDKYQAIQEYIFNVLLFNSFIGVVLLPFVLSNAVMLKFNKLFLTISLILAGSAYLYRNWRAVRIGLSYHFPVYYIFLYLCTLEILPSIVLIKLLQV